MGTETDSQVLDSLRAPAKIKTTNVPELDDLAARHVKDTQAARIAIAGRSLPLVNRVVESLLAHGQTLVVVDVDARFDVTCLSCDVEDLQHIYVVRPARSTPDHLRQVVADAGEIMLYGDHVSKDREYWGTIVLGGLAAGDLIAGWKGWLRVDKGQPPGFALGVTADEALAQRDKRQLAVDELGWAASSAWGGFTFGERRK